MRQLTSFCSYPQFGHEDIKREENRVKNALALWAKREENRVNTEARDREWKSAKKTG